MSVDEKQRVNVPVWAGVGASAWPFPRHLQLVQPPRTVRPIRNHGVTTTRQEDLDVSIRNPGKCRPLTAETRRCTGNRLRLGCGKMRLAGAAAAWLRRRAAST
jgi:hypothetical protein